MKSAQAGWRCAGYESNSDRLRSIQPAQRAACVRPFWGRSTGDQQPGRCSGSRCPGAARRGRFPGRHAGAGTAGADRAHQAKKTAQGTLLLGICLGMQMLFDESEEFGLHKGLGLIPGRVVRIPDVDADGSPSGCRTSAGTHCTRRAAARIFFRYRLAECAAGTGMLFYPLL